MSEVAQEYYAGMFEYAGLEVPNTSFYEGKAQVGVAEEWRLPLQIERLNDFRRLGVAIGTALLRTRVLINLESLTVAATAIPATETTPAVELPSLPTRSKYSPERQSAIATGKIVTQLKPRLPKAGAISGLRVVALAPEEVKEWQDGLLQKLQPEEKPGIEPVERLATYMAITGDITSSGRKWSAIGAVAAFHGVKDLSGEAPAYGIYSTAQQLKSARRDEETAYGTSRENAFGDRAWNARHPYRST